MEDINAKKSRAWKDPEFRRNYYKHIEQGMDEFESSIRAVQHIVYSGDNNMSKEEVEDRRLYD